MFATLVIGLLSILFAFFFFYTRFEHVICDNNVCMVGKTALVTGGSKGLGYEIVLQLAARGCRIIIASRTGSENLRKRIIEETNNPNIVLEYVDFLSFRSVRELAKRLNESEKKIDILVNNAGVGASHSEPTEDGLNRTMQINHYSGFLLTHLIADLLKNSENGRIIFTSSFLAAFHLMRKSSATPTKIHDSPLNTINYANSKLCAIIMAEMFARKLNKWNITSNCYQPGIARTEIFSESQKNLKGSIDKVIYYSTMHVLEVIFGVSPKLTSQTAVHIATAKEYKHLTGQYVGRFFNNVKPKLAYDKEFCENLWKASEVTVKLKPEEKIEYNT